MAGLIRKIYGKPGENSVDSRDTAKTPTPMQAVTGLRQVNQRVDVMPTDFTGSRKFFELFFHKAKAGSKFAAS
jgi:hypothetical protein